jgi:hypothetical protein
MQIACLALISALPLNGKANPPGTDTNNEKAWTGTLVAVNTRQNTVTGKHLLITSTFNLGNNCAILGIDKKEVKLSDLLPGEKIVVRYQNAQGVLVADGITEKALHYRGTVHAVDAKTGTVVMDESALVQPFHAPRSFHLAGDCAVMLRDGSKGALSDVRPGDRIAVIYELPNGSAVAYRINEESSTYVGMVEAIDLSTQTVRAKGVFGEKQFELANGCQIIGGEGKAMKLKDLALGRQYQFTYEAVNGVNVADQIALPPGAKSAETASAK